MPLAYNADEPMPAQTRDWTCSACALAWLNRALLIDHATDEFSAVEYIGEPENINSSYGLMDASGVVLAQRLREQGAPAFNMWIDWEYLYAFAAHWPFLIGGIEWNHWVGVRYARDGSLHIANSARGWMGIYDTLTFDDFEALGPWAAVPVPLLRNFPPPPTA